MESRELCPSQSGIKDVLSTVSRANAFPCGEDLAAARRGPEQPPETEPDESCALMPRAIAVGDHEPFDRLGEDTTKSAARRSPVEKTQSPFASSARMGLHDPIQPRDDTPPAREPVGGKVLDQIGEQHRAAGGVMLPSSRLVSGRLRQSHCLSETPGRAGAESSEEHPARPTMRAAR
jgi:hypothetical protein